MSLERNLTFDVKNNEHIKCLIDYTRPPETEAADIFKFVHQYERIASHKDITANDPRIESINNELNKFVMQKLLPTAQRMDKRTEIRLKKRNKAIKPVSMLNKKTKSKYDIETKSDEDFINDNDGNKQPESDEDYTYAQYQQEVIAAQQDDNDDYREFDIALKKCITGGVLDELDNNNDNDDDNDDYMISAQTDLQCDFMENTQHFNDRINKMENEMKVYSIFII